ncbi:DUF2624 domain-containing protein [Bacillus sp. FJAT-47783]|uniref:DUF2624 domain-containing protein n=1 Tax=Bacillus sp. FJAT-47783 TaxID=2922712 RepID=UPI001FAC721F|nr:DUF2624 domain-containing protein [Bacillus sp. FJAT-47783]
MILFQKIVNQKINNLKYDELLNYAKQHQIALSETQAKQIVKLIRGKNINIFDDQERINLLKKIAKITSNETAQKVNKIFLDFIE